MRVQKPRGVKHTNLTVRADGELLERLDGLLGLYQRRWPSEKTSMTRSWLVTELLESGIDEATEELERLPK
jgi:predicted DNA-binding protein